MYNLFVILKQNITYWAMKKITYSNQPTGQGVENF